MAWKFNPFSGTLNYFEPAGGGGAVSSVNTRTGAVTGLAENSDLTAHTGNTSNPHSVTKAQVGLSNVPNTDFTAAVGANTAKISFDSTSSTRLADTSGLNTGNNATNTQYSGLAASKQDTLVSATNIKTINSVSLLGAGDIVISGSGLSQPQIMARLSIGF